MSMKKRFWEQVFHKIGSPNSVLQGVLGSPPFHTKLITRSTNLKSDRSCQRSILELCALKMTDTEREHLVGKVRDEMYKDLREPVLWVCDFVGGNPLKNISSGEIQKMSLKEIYEICKPWSKWSAIDICTFERIWYQAWYKTSVEGQINVLEVLYWIIRASPQSFCNMLRQEKAESNRCINLMPSWRDAACHASG